MTRTSGPPVGPQVGREEADHRVALARRGGRGRPDAEGLVELRHAVGELARRRARTPPVVLGHVSRSCRSARGSRSGALESRPAGVRRTRVTRWSAGSGSRVDGAAALHPLEHRRDGRRREVEHVPELALRGAVVRGEDPQADRLARGGTLLREDPQHEVTVQPPARMKAPKTRGRARVEAVEGRRVRWRAHRGGASRKVSTRMVRAGTDRHGADGRAASAVRRRACRPAAAAAAAAPRQAGGGVSSSRLRDLVLEVGDLLAGGLDAASQGLAPLGQDLGPAPDQDDDEDHDQDDDEVDAEHAPIVADAPARASSGGHGGRRP